MRKPLIYFIMSLWHLTYKPNVMKEVNFKEFHDFLVSIGKRTVKIVRRWGLGSPLLPLSHYGNGEAKAILKCSNVMYLHCYNFCVQNAAIEPQCKFQICR